jgi:hypothetical protein
VPRQGAINGNQYLTIKKSGFSLIIFFATEIQLNGFIEFIILLIKIFFGGSDFSYWVFPGKKNSGY